MQIGAAFVGTSIHASLHARHSPLTDIENGEQQSDEDMER